MKICGNRSSGDILLAKGADYIGFVISTPRSPRSLEIRNAAPLFMEASQYAKTVAVVTDADHAFLEDVSSALEPDFIQLHLLLSPAEIASVVDSVPAGIIALARPELSFADTAREIASLTGMVIVDTFSGGEGGGTGIIHDWSVSRALREAIHPSRLMLSGGLNPGNVAEAIRTVVPAAVDVSSGVESGGLKSGELVDEFIGRVRRLA